MAARAVTRAYDEALRPVGLRSTQFTVLVAASVANGIPLNRLATMLGLENDPHAQPEWNREGGPDSDGERRRPDAECRADAARRGPPGPGSPALGSGSAKAPRKIGRT